MTIVAPAPAPTVAYEDAPCGYLATRPDGVILSANKLVRQWSGRSAEQLVDGSTRLIDLLAPGSRIFHDTHYTTLMALQGFANEVSFDLVGPDAGSARFPILLNAQDRTAEDGQPYRSITVFNATETRRHEHELIKARRAAEASAEALYAQHERLRVTLHSITDAVITIDSQGRIESMNVAAETLCGTTLGEMLLQPPSALGQVLCATTRVPRPPPEDAGLEDSQVIRSEGDSVLVRHDDEERIVEDMSAPIRDATGNVVGAVWTLRDLTSRRRADRAVAYGMTHDQLTGLINRLEFERLTETLGDSPDDCQGQATPDTQTVQPHAVCVVDLDRFKLLNDTVGHLAGDQALQTVAATLKNVLRRSDTLARLGGNTFGVLLKGCDLDNALRLAEQLRAAVERIEMSWSGTSFSVTATVGVAATSALRGTDTLMADAELACLTAKESGRNRCFHFEGEALMERRGEMHWVSRIDRALAENRFVLHCQPIVPIGQRGKHDTRKGEILVRMLDESGKILSPASFIPAAERYGKMQAIDRWVMCHALAWMKGRPEVECSINVSGQSLGDPAFLCYAVEQLGSSQVNASRLTFEITETAAVSSVDMALRFIETLKSLGAHFALDDFGAGLASFAYLKQFPVDFVKIDGSFVKQMLLDVQSRVIVESIQRIAAATGLQTVAEWVESDEMLAALEEMGIDYAQGWATGKPVELSQW